MTDQSSQSRKEDRIDLVFRNLMLGCGIITALSFLLSLVSFIQFPEASTALVITFLGSALLFLVVRVIYRFRVQFKLKDKKRANRL